MTSSIGNVASLAARAGGNVVRQVRSAIDPSAARPAVAGRTAAGWLAVTVFREPSDVDITELPAPLASSATGSRSASGRRRLRRARAVRLRRGADRLDGSAPG
jgi:hypothetical protein